MCEIKIIFSNTRQVYDIHIHQELYAPDVRWQLFKTNIIYAIKPLIMSQKAHEIFVQGRIPVAIFASGGGSNAEAIIHYSYRTDAAYHVALLISNNSTCGAMALATMFNIPTLHISSVSHPDSKNYNSTLIDMLRAYNIQIIALAGYMKKLPDEVITAFRNSENRRIYNIHPALLPKFGGAGMYGIKVHQAVIASGDMESGCTVHEVEREYDTGTIIAQKSVPVLPNDTPELLASRVLEWEHRLYPQVLHERSVAMKK